MTSPDTTVPVACYLDRHDYRERVARIGALMDEALLSRERGDSFVRLHFRTDEAAQELETLVALEQECCPFLVFDLQQLKDEAVLTISGPREAGPLLDEAFGGAIKAP